MKISEGIRIGSQGKQQIKTQWHDNKGGVCAIGALMTLPNASMSVYRGFPELETVKVYGPTLYNPTPQEQPLISHIITKNEAGETFEQIIKWLESIGQ